MSRPRNISIGSLMRYHWPVMAIASIFHRVSGVVLFILIPFMLYLFHTSVHSAAGFASMQMLLSSIWCKVLLWAFLSALAYHFIAGIKHLLMDWGFLEELLSAKISSSIVIGLSAIEIVLLGVWLW